MRKIIIGIDEIGRGAWAGPLVFAALFLPESIHILPSVHISDSKAPNRLQDER